MKDALKRWWKKFKNDHIIADAEPARPAAAVQLEYVVRTEAGLYLGAWPGYGEPAFTSRIQQAKRFAGRWEIIRMLQAIEATLPPEKRVLAALWTALPVVKGTGEQTARRRA